jgi:hypothetical protein
MYVYILSEPELWTVGFYNPDGRWISESDHTTADAAAKRVAWLNGSKINDN